MAKKWKFETERQMSDTVYVMTLLTLSGGVQDAYSYFVRGKVFANAQTGNFVLMAMDFFTGDFASGAKYILPVAAFGMGTLVAEQMRGRYTEGGRVHWRQRVLLLEILLLGLVGLLPVSSAMNPIANALTSFACAMQVQAFRKVNGHSYASTMCIGNIRSGMASFSAYLRLKESALLRKAGWYFLVIFVFFIGAGIGSLLSKLTGAYDGYVIFLTCIFLGIAFLLMLLHPEDEMK